MTTALERTLAAVTADLGALGAKLALVGGLAVSARAEPRFTRDVDLVVVVDGDAEAEGLIRDLRARGYEVLTLVEQEAAGRLATVRLVPASGTRGGVVVDLLFASSGIEREVADAAEAVEIFPGVVTPVAQTGHLLALKILSRAPSRPQDDVDIAALLEVATDHDLELARSALEMISARGFDRNRDLPARLEALVSRRRDAGPR